MSSLIPINSFDITNYLDYVCSNYLVIARTGGDSMNAAQTIIEKFGGQTALANLLGKGQSTVQHWVKVGMIPAKWQGEILRIARTKGIELQPIDFMHIPGNESEEIDGQLPKVPVARWPGFLTIGNVELPVYVIDDGRRVISRTGATGVLIGRQGGGKLESYIAVGALRKYIPSDLPGQMIAFSMPGVVNKTVRGISAETFLEICRAYVKALDENASLTDHQRSVAIKASMFLASCAKVGLIALIDEATGYQYERTEDALQPKLRLYLSEEMRKWEKTFPDEIWVEFGRLTNWKGSITKRPKYWGKLVMELVYEYLDPDVAKWLKENAPKPQGGQNYHRWLSGQYGLRKLVEHIWKLVGIAKTCHTILELKDKMAEIYGKVPVQYTLYLPPPEKSPGTPAISGERRR
jgi:P63C domain